MLLMKNILRTKNISWKAQIKSLEEGLEDKIADEKISQKADQKDKKHRREKIRKLENQSGRYNIQIKGVPERIEKIEEGV